MFKWIANKVSSAVPKVVNVVKGAVKSVSSVVKKVVSAVPKMINAMKNLVFTFKDNMNKFLDSLDPELQEILFGIERGKLGSEAIAFLSRWQFRLMDYGLKKLNQGIESVPWLSTIANAPGEAWKWVTDKASQGLTDFGRMVNDAEIPVVSDFLGSFTGVSEGNGSLASIYGAYGRGIWVKGVGGTIDGLMTIVTNPLESAQGVTHLVANAEEMAPKIAGQIGDYVDKNLINGTAESRAEFAGQVVFEVATAVATCGTGTAAKAGVKGADTAVDVARMADKAGDVARAADKASDAARAADKAGDAARAADKASDIAKAADKTSDATQVGESGVKIKGPVEEAKVKKVPGEGGIEPVKNNLVNKIKDIRGQMPNTNLAKRGNMAVADVNVPGVKKNFVAHSKINSELDKGANIADFSYLKSADERVFNSYVVDKFPRYHDTEAKILEDIAAQITDTNISGTINLYSELPCCQSCSNIILEFRRKFPNIKLNVYVE